MFTKLFSPQNIMVNWGQQVQPSSVLMVSYYQNLNPIIALWTKKCRTSAFAEQNASESFRQFLETWICRGAPLKFWRKTKQQYETGVVWSLPTYVCVEIKTKPTHISKVLKIPLASAVLLPSHGSQNWTDGIYSITDLWQPKRICGQKLIRDDLILPAAGWLARPHQTLWRRLTVSNRC